ncbi:MAG: DUF4340 domain-containing protein [Planctomycetaceae bacterium]|nr:DUF4340 domain-containing protein [Planctomycetaceae bacterium]
MHKGKLILLVLAVALLAGLAWWRSERGDDPLAEGSEMALCPNLDVARVAGIRTENTAARQEVRMERDEQGVWWLVEPLEWRADDGVVRQLLEIAQHGRGVPAPDLEPEDAGLSPPKATLEFLERRLDGSERRHRIAFGANDIGPQRMFALVGDPGAGTLVRTSRAPMALLELPVHEFRDRRLVHAQWNQVTALERRGALQLPQDGEAGETEAPPPWPLDVRAEAETDGWYSSDPVRVRLDPQALGLLLRALTQLRARGFYDDSPDETKSLGLDPPQFELTFELGGGDSFSYRVGHRQLAPDEPIPEFDDLDWLVQLEGRSHVMRLDGLDVRLLASPLEHLVDHQLVRFDRTQARAVTVELDGRRIELVRPFGQWLVPSEGGGRPADAATVGDLFTALERLELLGFPWLTPQGAGPAVDPGAGGVVGRLEVRVDGPDGELVLGGEFAAPVEIGGVRGRPYRRLGEVAFGLLAEEDLGRLLPDPSRLLSLELLNLDELRQSEVRASGLGRTRHWVRDPQKGHWTAVGAELEDKRFALIVDALLRVRAERMHTASELGERGLVETVDVELIAADGTSARYQLGRAPDLDPEGVFVRIDGTLARVAPAGYERLRELLDVR